MHYPAKGYPRDIDLIVSDQGYGANECIKTTNPIVIVTGPGPGSGKLATCLCNLYHEYKNGMKAGYTKFETFPIWNLLTKNIVDSVTYLKKNILEGKMVSLDVEETLILLGISALSNPAAQMAMENLKWLRDCEVHLTLIPTPGEEAGLRKLKVNVKCDPEFSNKSLFIGG